LRGKLRPQIEIVQSCSKDIKNAIALAKATSDRREQEFQKQERNFAMKHRKKFSDFVSKSQKDFESTKEWQLQRDQVHLSKSYSYTVIFTLTRAGKHKTELLNMLSTYEYQKNYYQARKKRHINTATWLFSTPDFIKWKDGTTPSVFILTGKRKCITMI
jgi:hypothetical protein